MEFIKQLTQEVDREWDRIKSGPFWQHALSGTFDARVYAEVMSQIYHYTRHNSNNQAVAAFAADECPHKLLAFVYRHAMEELGHEDMAKRDLRRAKLIATENIHAAQLPETQALIGYLYFVGLKRGPIARLGYSFWAENCYTHLGEVVAAAKRDLKLSDAEMSFLVSHSEIDAKHSREVMELIEEYVTDEAQERAVRDVALTTLRLTGHILESALRHARSSSLTGVRRDG